MHGGADRFCGPGSCTIFFFLLNSSVFFFVQLVLFNSRCLCGRQPWASRIVLPLRYVPTIAAETSKADWLLHQCCSIFDQKKKMLFHLRVTFLNEIKGTPYLSFLKATLTFQKSPFIDMMHGKIQ